VLAGPASIIAENADLRMDDTGLLELNEAFAV